jgi:hypothetical protein
MPPTATTDTSAAPTLDQAFEQAKAEHSPAPESKTPAAAEHAPSAKTSETSDGKPAATSTPAAQASTATTEGATDDTTLISDEEYARLATEHKDDPAALRKALNTAFTTKLQKLADDRRGLEGWQEVIEGFESDLEGTLAELAEQQGYRLVKPDGETGPTTATTVAKDAVVEAVDAFKASLPEEYKFLGEELGPAFKAMAENIATAVIAKHVGPLKAQADTLVERAATEQTTATMQAFGKAHPDWQTHEPAMMALAGKLSPTGMTELEYLDTLYYLATKETATATAASKAVERMVEAATKAEPKTESTPEARVRRAPRNPTIEEAFEAAKRGERFED